MTNRERAEWVAVALCEYSSQQGKPCSIKNDLIEQALNEVAEEQRKKIKEELERIHTPNKRGGWSCKHCTGYADDDVVCYKCIAKAIEGET